MSLYSDTVNTNSHKEQLKGLTCDKCRAKPATRWFGSTSMALCGSDSCYSEAFDEYNSLKSSYEEEY